MDNYPKYAINILSNKFNKKRYNRKKVSNIVDVVVYTGLQT